MDISTAPTSTEMAAAASEVAFGQPLVENYHRGLLVEVIVAAALAGPGGWRHSAGGWGGWDFEHEDGTRLEIKQSAARQTWVAPATTRSPAFSIAMKTGTYQGADWLPLSPPSRPAQIYVFAHHSRTDDAADHRDPLQWGFYVVDTRRLPPGKTIGLEGVKRLAPAAPWSALAIAVERVRRDLDDERDWTTT